VARADRRKRRRSVTAILASGVQRVLLSTAAACAIATKCNCAGVEAHCADALPCVMGAKRHEVQVPGSYAEVLDVLLRAGLHTTCVLGKEQQSRDGQDTYALRAVESARRISYEDL